MITKAALEARLKVVTIERENKIAEANALAGAARVLEQLIADCDKVDQADQQPKDA